MNFEAAYKFAVDLLKNKLPGHLAYHNVPHTKNVVTAVKKIAMGEKVGEEDTLLLQTAAAFHDTGFTETYFSNEPIGSKIAMVNLPKFGYNQEQITKISNLILATAFPQKPNTELDKILCDADLAYVGQKNFIEIADGLKSEFLYAEVIKSEIDWLKLQVTFLENYKFHTKTAKKMGLEQHSINLATAKKNYYMYVNTFPVTE